MIERFPVNISTVAHCFDLNPRTLFTWYKDVISHYHLDKQQGRYAGKKVYRADSETGEITHEQVVHINHPHHLGESMCIDEKMINGRYCTILSNQQSGHISLLIDTVKPDLVQSAITQLGAHNLAKIKYINSDMSPVMKKICTQTMPDAPIIIDKFHVLKHTYDALQSVRLDIKKTLKASPSISLKNPHGWTDIELIEKTKYLLYKPTATMDIEQTQLLTLVLDKHPALTHSAAFSLVLDFF